MKTLRLLLLVMIAGVLSFGAICGGKKSPTLTPPKPAEQPEEQVTIEKPKVENEIPTPPVEEEAKEPIVFENIYFDFNKYELKPEARGILNRIAEKLRENPEVNIRIEGNCDERGTEQYNLALGEKRALEAKKFLIGAGISANRIEIISYGEENPIDPGHNEKAWAKNRRDEFKILQ